MTEEHESFVEARARLPKDFLRNETRSVIAAAIAVHRALGPGYFESIYENALALELEAAGIPFKVQQPVPVVYRGRIVGEGRLDVVV